MDFTILSTSSTHTMDKLLRLERFTAKPNNTNAVKLYKHWKTTSQNYLVTSLPAPTEGQPVDAATDCKILFALVNNVSATVYDIISEKTTFDIAILAMDTAYIKPVSVIFNRHKLISRNQEHNRSDSYLQDLECITKTCGFEAVLRRTRINMSEMLLSMV